MDGKNTIGLKGLWVGYPSERMIVEYSDPHMQVDHNLAWHKPNSREVEEMIDQLRVETKKLGHKIVDLVPNSRERSLALTHLEDAAHWAIAGLVRNQTTIKVHE